MNELNAALADRFAQLALSHAGREYPNKLDHVMTGDQDVQSPKALHPIFYGSFDWHSCVHGYWTLATMLRLFPGMPSAPAIRSLFNAAFTVENVETERAYAARPSSRGFERPYGWGWCLMLAAELKRHTGATWFKTFDPLARQFVDRWRAFLPLSEFPVRVGTHPNTAFALRLSLDYARETSDRDLERALAGKAREWYTNDRDCQAWEPSQDDFLSSALIEAEAMRAALDPDSFVAWFEGFLPSAARRQPATLFVPVTPRDRTDGKLAHLDGLNLSRAWCWRGIAATLGSAHPVHEIANEAADRHLAAGLPQVAGDYMGEHWLASFALLALTAGR